MMIRGRGSGLQVLYYNMDNGEFTMGKYNVCENCHIAFYKELDGDCCPKCGRIVNDESWHEINTEGDGRQHHAGGDACNYCPHCVGNANWCPYMD